MPSAVRSKGVVMFGRSGRRKLCGAVGRSIGMAVNDEIKKRGGLWKLRFQKIGYLK